MVPWQNLLEVYEKEISKSSYMRILTLLMSASLFAGTVCMAQGTVPVAAFAPTLKAPSSRLSRVQAARVVRVCIWPDYYGITYRNPKTQQLSGLDIELAQELGKDLGVSVDFVDSSFAKLTDDMLHDHCDVAMFAVGITPERQKQLRFTRPYLASDIYAVTSKTNRHIRSWADIDQKGSVVARGTRHAA